MERTNFILISQHIYSLDKTIWVTIEVIKLRFSVEGSSSQNLVKLIVLILYLIKGNLFLVFFKYSSQSLFFKKYKCKIGSFL